MEDVEIRPARPDELEAVLGVWTAAGSVPSVSDSPEALARLLTFDGDALLVAVTGGRVVGTLIAAWDGWRGAMYRLAVVPDQRHRGIATALVGEGERRLAAKGSPRVAAIVMREHDHATGFWRRFGYRFDTRVGRWVHNLGGGGRPG